MEQNYTIDEILSAVDEIQNKKKIKKIDSSKIIPTQKNNSLIPKDTLKLIEEAEKFKS